MRPKDVYLIKATSTSPNNFGAVVYKVGYSSNIVQRLHEVQKTYAVKDAEIIATRSGGMIVEAMLHMALSPSRCKAIGLGFEFFDLSNERLNTVLEWYKIPEADLIRGYATAVETSESANYDN